MAASVNAFMAWLFASPFPSALLLFVFSWFLMLVTGRGLIEWLKNLKGMKWSPREDTPDSHLQKAGTPSMGGIGIIGVALGVYTAFFVSVVVIETLTARVPFRWIELWAYVLFPAVVGAHCLLGFGDDWSKARGTGGLRSRSKFLWQCLLATLFITGGIFLGWLGARGMVAFDFWLPFALEWPVAWVIWPIFFVLIVVATSNAVNLTDGIDGLAAGLSLQCALSFGLVGLLELPSSQGHPEVFWTWMCLGGACLGFLAFNKNPAKVFMGDTGSLALGAALGAGAILTRSVFLLPFIGFIFWIEMFSVIFQVLYFKWTKRKTGEGKRIFRRAPLHHHFELSGWSEWRVVGTFWLVNLVATGVGLVLWKMGILPRFP